MNELWQEVPLGEVIDNYDSKRIPLSTKERSMRQGQYPYYGASGIIDYIDNYIFDGCYLLISEDGENLNTRKTPIAFLAKGKFWVNNHAHIVKGKEGKAHTDYIRYWFSQADISGYITGAAQPKLSQGNLNRILIRLPDIKKQNEIVLTLLNYDDLIENNTRRIAILETIVQNLYREWFINFRFPNHEQAQWQDTPQGKIPLGWAIKKLAEIATVNPESITKKNEPDDIHYIDISSVNTGSIEEIKPMSFAEAPSRARRIVRHGDIIWATVRPNRKQFSYIAKPIENTIVSTGFAVLRAQKVPASFLYQATTTDNFTAYLVNHATGAAYPAVNSTVFESAEILVPDEALLAEFDELVGTTMTQVEVLKRKNNNLKQQCDMLLPKLITHFCPNE